MHFLTQLYEARRWSATHPSSNSTNFLLTNINFSKLSDCKRQFFKYFASISTKEKKYQFQFKILQCQGFDKLKKPIIDSYFLHHYKGHLMSFTYTWYLLNLQLHIDKLFSWLIGPSSPLKDVQTIFSSLWLLCHKLRFCQKV